MYLVFYKMDLGCFYFVNKNEENKWEGFMDEGMEERIDLWMDSIGANINSPTSKKREYFSQKKLSIYMRSFSGDTELLPEKEIAAPSNIESHNELSSTSSPSKTKLGYYKSNTFTGGDLINSISSERNEGAKSYFELGSPYQPVLLKQRSSLLSRRGIELLEPIEMGDQKAPSQLSFSRIKSDQKPNNNEMIDNETDGMIITQKKNNRKGISDVQNPIREAVSFELLEDSHESSEESRPSRQKRENKCTQ